MKSLRQILFLIITSIMIFNCRSDELKSGGSTDVLRNPVSSLFTLAGTSGFGSSSSSSSGNLPRNFKVTGGSLFAVSGYSLSIFESTDGNTFNKKTFTLPDCSVTYSGSESDYTECSISTLSKSGSNYYAIAIKERGSRSSGSSTISSRKFYFGSGTSLEGFQFSEITDSNITSTVTNGLISYLLPSAASSSGFVFGFSDTNSSHKYCATANNGSSWTCVAGVATGSSPGSVELLNGILAADYYFRWNGSFTAVTTTNQGTNNSIYYRTGRTHFSSGNAFRYTDTDPGSWVNPVSTTNSTTTNPVTSGGYYLLGDISGTFSALGNSFVSGTNSYFSFTTSDNGVNWSRQISISLPNGQPISGTPTGFNNTVYVYTQTSGGSNFSQKYYKSSNFTDWTEVVP